MFRRKLRHLLAAWRLVRGFRQPEPVDWNRHDELALQQFLASNTGRKFGYSLRGTAFNAALGVAVGGNDILHKAGYAAGVMATAAHVDALAAWGRVDEGMADSRPADNLDWMTQPQAQNDA